MTNKKVKVKEPSHNEKNWCRRCNKTYCDNCVDVIEVDFDVKDNVNPERPDLEHNMENFKGVKVCPWCYNQLIDLKQFEENVFGVKKDL